MFDLKINKKRLAMHWHYYRFKYLIFLVAALVATNLLLSGTTPKTPADRKVDVFILSGAYSTDYVDSLQKELLCALPVDQKEVNLISTPTVEGQDLHMILAARMAAREGDIWILPSDFYISFAQGGAFVPLEGRLSEFNLPEGFDPSAARVIVQTDESAPGEQHICGIPLDRFKGLYPYFIPDGMVMAFSSYTGANTENAIRVANRLLSMTDLSIQSLQPGGGNLGCYIATQYIDFKGAAAWKTAIDEKMNYNPEMSGVFPFPYQMGRESQVAELLRSRMPNYASGMLMVRREVFTILARQGALMPLDDATHLLKLPEGTDLSAGREAAVDKKGVAGPQKIYGIPLDNFTGLSAAFNPRDMVLAFPVMSNESLAAAIDAAKAVLESKG